MSSGELRGREAGGSTCDLPTNTPASGKIPEQSRLPPSPSPTQTAEEKVLSSKAVCASVMLKSALLTLAHPTEGEAPLLNTICLQRGAAKSRDYWRGWGSEAPKERGAREGQGQAVPRQNRERGEKPNVSRWSQCSLSRGWNRVSGQKLRTD